MPELRTIRPSGPCIVFGRGGTAVEVIGDKALALPPLDLKLARELISRTRVSRVLKAYRDVPAADEDAIALLLVKLAQLAADLPEVRELDLNPLLADENGLIAVDARVAVAPVDPARSWPIGPSTLRDPALSHGMGDDPRRCATARGFLCDRCGQKTSRCMGRFLPRSRRRTCGCASSHRSRNSATPSSRASPRLITRAPWHSSQSRNCSGKLLGVVRLHANANYDSGEFAVLVRSDLKGRGLGWLLMQMIIEYARAEGLKTIEGQVLSENTAMLAMCRELGFDLAPDPQRQRHLRREARRMN